MQKENLENLLSTMTLAEKIGQLVQLTPNFFEETGATGEITGPLEEMGMTEDELYTIGSVLGTHTKEEVLAIQKSYLEKSRLKIPLVFMADVIHGYETIFPVPLALASSFNPELIEKVASYSAKETVEAGVHVTFSPMVDLVRDPRWGRVMEATGEDPLLNSRLGAAFVRGYQGAPEKLAEDFSKIAACVKHFAGYGAAEGGRDYNTVDLSTLNLYENYLPSFKAAIDAGAKLVMTSFNVMQGIPSTANRWLLKNVLRDHLDFSGLVISDWGAVRELVPHRIASDLKVAAELSLNAGCDMDMMSNAYMKNLAELVAEGKVLEADVDQSVLHVLELKNDLGLFEDPYRGLMAESQKITAGSEIRQVAREAASQSMVLLKNEKNILPLNSQQKVALVGPMAESQDVLGAWSWIGKTEQAVNLATGLKKVLPELTVVGTSDRLKFSEKELADMFIAAKHADVVIVALGESSLESGEATSKGDISLPKSQMNLLKKISEINPQVVTVLFNGRPIILGEVVASAQAVLEGFFPGSEAGNSLADVLTGVVAPTGKLPMSYPVSVGQIPVHYDELSTGRPLTENYGGGGYVSFYLDQPNAPLFPFGYGLTYGALEISEVNFTEKMSDELPVKIFLKNDGPTAVTETLQLYVQDCYGTVALPKRRLREFTKVTVAANSSEVVTLNLKPADLSYVHSDLENFADPGEFEIFVGFDSNAESFGKFELI
ncbi:glycoside hydrolase family 3 N-terminal domain-containing protein [Enterococcus timonensis]|uniref:glycoside hydrolase family 3 N-terminal domain-containing protein n=1 Tax=Enterococcus timonensis TaxID=1852364 RepID=UPI0008D90EB7|nr:glycoside hydrolase family 3 N-terminal domain-containing protein [Enterococcus timonensis]